MSKEILMVVESVSLEKGVPKEVIIDALEHALAMATKKRYQENAEFRVSINRDTGEYSTFRTWKVVDLDALPEEEEPNPAAQLTLEEAQAKDPNLNLGDVDTRSRWIPWSSAASLRRPRSR